MSSEPTSQIDKQLAQIDNDMRRRDEQVSSLASTLARQGEMLNNVVSTVGSLANKVDQAMSTMQTMAGKSGRLDITTIVAVISVALALWAFAISPLAAKVESNTAASESLRKEVTERDREHLTMQLQKSHQSGYVEAQVDRLLQDQADTDAQVGQMRDTRFTKSDGIDQRREVLSLLRAELGLREKDPHP